MALAAVTALWARRHVVRPIRIFGTLAIAGAAAALIAFAGIAVPRAFLVMTASLALAFSVNRRPLRRPSRPALRRGLWIAAAAVMLAAMEPALSFETYGGGGIGAVSVGLIELVIEALPILAALAYIVRGMLADRGDRLLIGAAAGLLLSPVVDIVDLFTRPQTIASASVLWSYPYWVLLGAALARANGNMRRP